MHAPSETSPNHHRPFIRRLVTAAALILLAAGVLYPWHPARASERHFTYTYESGVLNPGAVEIEPWTTFRSGRTDFYRRYDNRLEFEMGVARRLQTAWYINFTGLSEATTGGTRAAEFEFEGVSWEWKYKLTDPVADAFGSALYLEGTTGPLENELELKYILDKRFSNFLAAFNIVGEREWEFGSADTETESVLVFDAGLGAFLTPRLFAGIEARNHNEFTEQGWEHSALFAGPVLSYARSGWWFSLSVLPQLPALKGGEGPGHRILDEHEKVNARILFGFDL